MNESNNALKWEYKQTNNPDNSTNGDPYCLLGAKRYDIEGSCMSQRYKEAHKIQNSIVCNTCEISTCEKPVVIDFGCGTGTDGIDILSKNRRAIYIGIDSSTHMLNIAKKKFEQKFTDRYVFLNLDFQQLTFEYLLSKLKTIDFNLDINCIISSFVLHHYSIETRQNFYNLVFKLLQKDGIFILTDLFKNSIDICNQLALDQEVSEIKEAIEILEQKGLSENDNSTLSIKHYLNKNRPSLLLRESEMLLNNGFDCSDVTYRNGQIGVIVANRR